MCFLQYPHNRHIRIMDDTNTPFAGTVTTNQTNRSRQLLYYHREHLHGTALNSYKIKILVRFYITPELKVVITKFCCPGSYDNGSHLRHHKTINDTGLTVS